MTAAKRPPSAVESNANPLRAFFEAHPGSARVIAKGVWIGAAVGIGIGLGLPGRGAWYRAAVALLVALGCALVGGLIAGAKAIPANRGYPTEPGWVAKVDAKMKAEASSPVPKRVSLKQEGDG